MFGRREKKQSTQTGRVRGVAGWRAPRWWPSSPAVTLGILTAALVVYWGTWRWLEIYCFAGFTTEEFAFFWTVPCFAGRSLLTIVKTINILFVAFVGIALFGLLVTRQRGKPVFLVCYLVALLLVGGIQYVFHVQGRTIEHFRLLWWGDPSWQPTLAIRYGTAMKRSPRGSGLSQLCTRVVVLPLDRYGPTRSGPHVCGDVHYEMNGVEHCGRGVDTQPFGAFIRRLTDHGANKGLVWIRPRPDALWQHVEACCWYAVNAGCRNVFVGDKYVAEVAITDQNMPLARLEKEKRAVLVEVPSQWDVDPSVNWPKRGDPGARTFALAAWYEVGVSDRVEVGDVPGLRALFAGRFVPAKHRGGTDPVVRIRASHRIRFRDIEPIFEAAVGP